jgi:tryptophan synthase alpha chain
MAHMVAGYPDRRASLAVARALVDGGCAYLELQFPFSDPTADGPDIQSACAAALAAGFTVADGFLLAAEIRSFTRVPLYIMGYANLLFARGIGRFLAETKAAGAAGVIVPDLPPDYDEGLFVEAENTGLSAMPVVSPSMRSARRRRIASLRAPDIFATLRSGTTGASTVVDTGSLAFLGSIAGACNGPVPRIFAGFGVSRREQVTEIQPHVHAVVVGSALVREVANGREPFANVRRLVEDLARP